MYSEEELIRYKKELARHGITKDEEVKAVLVFIHTSVCIAVREYRLLNKNGSVD